MWRQTVRTSAGFSPCHITGFFHIRDRYQNPLRIGSTGAGVAIDKGVTTSLSVRRTRRPSTSITFNGRPLRNAIVSRKVSEEYVNLDGRAWDIRISHKCELPIGCGYGTSGAGALGLSLALNEAMGLSLTKTESAGIAHTCEVRCNTGLGTVASAFSGGFNVRTRPGAPGTGEVTRLRFSPSLRVVSASFGPLSTQKVLANRQVRKRVNTCGRTLTSRILRKSTETTFVALSRSFANCLGLMSPRLARLIDTLSANGVPSSMMMLGESLFCLLPNDRVREATALIRERKLVPAVSKISPSGARVV